MNIISLRYHQKEREKKKFMSRFFARAASSGLAVAVLAPAPASAQSLDLNYFWDYAEAGGVVVNTLNLISSSEGFTAQLFAETIGDNPFQDATGDLLPSPSPTDSFFAGGGSDPIIVGAAPEIGGSISASGTATLDSVVDATWITDFPAGAFPISTDPANPIHAGQFALGSGIDGQYTLRVNNAGGDPLQISGMITDGRFSQSFTGDVNLDGIVDLGDLVIVTNNFGGLGQSLISGDLSGDGAVDLGDLVIVTNDFGNTGSSVSLAVGSVPEPTSLALLIGFGSLALVRRRGEEEI